jgi:hypothetical protein
MWGGRTNNDQWKLLVTSDAELAASDAAYWAAVTGLDRLTAMAISVLQATAAPEAPSGGGTTPEPEGFPVVPLLGALAQAVPAIISLFQTNRTVTTGSVEIDDLAAAAAVAGVMKGENQQRTVFHDAFRVLPKGVVHDKVETVRDRREDLIKRKLELEARKPAGAADPEEATDLEVSIALVATVGDSIDEFLQTLTAVPEGGKMSAFAAAVLRQGLHDGSFTHVLCVKAQSASAIQVVGEKAFRNDPVAVLAAATITWMLIDATSGQLLDAGVTSGTAQATGKIGDAFHFTVPGEGGRR